LEGNNTTFLADATLSVRLNPSCFFGNNTVALYSVLVTNTKSTINVVVSVTNTTTVFNNNVITNIFTLSYGSMTQHAIVIRITVFEGLIRPDFLFTVKTFQHLIQNHWYFAGD